MLCFSGTKFEVRAFVAHNGCDAPSGREINICRGNKTAFYEKCERHKRNLKPMLQTDL